MGKLNMSKQQYKAKMKRKKERARKNNKLQLKYNTKWRITITVLAVSAALNIYQRGCYEKTYTSLVKENAGMRTAIQNFKIWDYGVEYDYHINDVEGEYTIYFTDKSVAVISETNKYYKFTPIDLKPYSLQFSTREELESCIKQYISNSQYRRK